MSQNDKSKLSRRLRDAALCVLAGIAVLVGAWVLVLLPLSYLLPDPPKGIGRALEKVIGGGILGLFMVVAVGVCRALFGRREDAPVEHVPPPPIGSFADLPRVREAGTK